MAKSLYEPLDPFGGHIRLLKLHPSKSESAPIRCELKEARLPSNTSFEALSYTWGDTAIVKNIEVNSSPLEIFQNLEAVLRRLRLASKPRILWADAICINQKDLKERSEQVVQMKQIYEQAEQVVIWLGEVGEGGRVGMKSLSTVNFSLKNNFTISRMKRKHGIGRSWKESYAASRVGEVESTAREGEFGEVAQLLDRPWWQRVWIIQEVVLAKKAVIVCGPDEVPWEAIKTRLRTNGTFGLQSQNLLAGFRIINGTVVEDLYHFPMAEYNLLSDLQTSWQYGAWNTSLCDLLFRFRRYKCKDPRDRIYGFLGLITAEESKNIIPDYSSPSSKVYIETARSLINSHRHLLLLNCKREPYQDGPTHQETQLYTLLDQGRFVDPHGRVKDFEGRSPRKGWVRLPDGWERVQDNVGWHYVDHNTGKPPQKNSPLIGPEPPSKAWQLRTLPSGWVKDWDNLGNVFFKYKPKQAEREVDPDEDLLGLPSWVSNWSIWSLRDPEPFPSLVGTDPGYWASGKYCLVNINPDDTLEERTLTLKGALFDSVRTLTTPWCPEPQNLPISRKGVSVLRSWEELALKPVSDCPYGGKRGRANAFWRTHIADFPGVRAASDEDRDYFEAWCDRSGWTPKASDVEPDGYQTLWQHANAPIVSNALADAILFVLQRQLQRVGRSGLTGAIALTGTSRVTQAFADYRAMMTRIYKASRNRALYVTGKGYIGLAPWNAREGDLVCVLLGGCTPFLLRPVPESKRYTLVGETYVYGIMGGELFGGKMGDPRLEDIVLV